MPIPAGNLNVIADQQDFIAQLRAVMEQLEGRRLLPYFDTAATPQITIGIGVNLDVNLAYVIGNTMGLSSAQKTVINTARNGPAMALNAETGTAAGPGEK